MILIDANLLLYAYDGHSPHHSAAHRWLQRTLSEPEPAALSWTIVLAFLRLATDPRVFRQPLSIRQATGVVDGWLGSSRFTILQPGDRHWDIFRRVLIDGQATGKLVMDAHLGALAIEHGATLASADRDFTRFPGLRILNPLQA